MGDAPTTGDAPTSRAGELALTALMLLPGALIVFMGFNAGGYFPATPALAAIVLAQILLVRIMQSRHPFEGLAPVTLVAIAALGLYALMTLISASWSHSIEPGADRVRPRLVLPPGPRPVRDRAREQAEPSLARQGPRDRRVDRVPGGPDQPRAARRLAHRAQTSPTSG